MFFRYSVDIMCCVGTSNSLIILANSGACHKIHQLSIQLTIPGQVIHKAAFLNCSTVFQKYLIEESRIARHVAVCVTLTGGLNIFVFFDIIIMRI